MPIKLIDKFKLPKKPTPKIKIIKVLEIEGLQIYNNFNSCF